MKRDMELIRLLMIQLTGEDVPELSIYTDEDKIYNYKLMIDANFIKGETGDGNAGEIGYVNIDRLTWDGHDFLDATKDSKVWKLALDYVVKPGVSWTFQTLLVYLKSQIDPLKIPLSGSSNL